MEESGSEYESESDEESKTQREQRIFDKVMEQKFLEYLKTPEGIAAAQVMPVNFVLNCLDNCTNISPVLLPG